MDLETIRPIGSGILGGLLSIWFLKKWVRYVPSSYQSKNAERLVEEHRLSIRVANVLFFGIIGLGIYLFKSGYLRSTSWHHFALIVGTAITVPVTAVILASLGKGRDRIAEALTAFAIAERTPVPVMLGIAMVGVISLASGLGGMSW